MVMVVGLKESSPPFKVRKGSLGLYNKRKRGSVARPIRSSVWRDTFDSQVEETGRL